MPGKLPINKRQSGIAWKTKQFARFNQKDTVTGWGILAGWAGARGPPTGESTPAAPRPRELVRLSSPCAHAIEKGKNPGRRARERGGRAGARGRARQGGRGPRRRRAELSKNQVCRSGAAAAVAAARAATQELSCTGCRAAAAPGPRTELHAAAAARGMPRRSG